MIKKFPRRGASPVSSATPSTELRGPYRLRRPAFLPLMGLRPAFSTSHGVKPLQKDNRMTRPTRGLVLPKKLLKCSKSFILYNTLDKYVTYTGNIPDVRPFELFAKKV